MRNLLLATAAILALAALAPANAASVNISNVTGTWTDVDPNGAATGVGTNEIKWGTPTTAGQSMYTFNSNVPPPVSLFNGQGFDLGQFVHTNNPITGNSITGATLDVAITFTSDFFSGSQTAHSIFNFLHNETTNATSPANGPCPGGTGPNGSGVNINGCADIVTAILNVGLSNVYVVGTHTYTFGITDFEVGGLHFAQFFSPELTANSAVLRASFTDVEQFAVPGPIAGAGIPGIVAALGMLVAGWRRRKQLT